MSNATVSETQEQALKPVRDRKLASSVPRAARGIRRWLLQAPALHSLGMALLGISAAVMATFVSHVPGVAFVLGGIAAVLVWLWLRTEP